MQNHFKTYFPIAVNKNRTESPKTLFVNGMFVTVSGNALFRIAWRSPWGAISIVIASLGMCLSESSNSTQLNRLFVWYSDDEYFPRSEFHSVSGNELLIHLEDLNFGVLITCKHNLIYLCSNSSFVITFFLRTSFKYLSRIGPADWIYRLWYAISAEFTAFANVPLDFSSDTNELMLSAGPDMVQLVALFRQATSMSWGRMSLIWWYPSPTETILTLKIN